MPSRLSRQADTKLAPIPQTFGRLSRQMSGSLVQRQILEGHQDRVWSVAWASRGLALASCSADKTVRIWLPDGAVGVQGPWHCSAVLEDTHARTVRGVAWSPDGRSLATASFDATASVWRQSESGDWLCVATLEGHESEVKGCAWSPSGMLLATCGRDKSVWVWAIGEDDGTGAVGDDGYECVGVLQGHTQDVKAVRWHPSGERGVLVSASYDDTVRIWAEESPEDWTCVQTLNGHASTVWDISFDREGRRLASSSADGTLGFWTCADGDNTAWTLESKLTGQHSRAVVSVDWAQPPSEGGGEWLVTAAGDDNIRVYHEPAKSRPTGFTLVASRAAAHASDVNCARWNPVVFGFIASAGDDTNVRLWDLTES